MEYIIIFFILCVCWLSGKLIGNILLDIGLRDYQQLTNLTLLYYSEAMLIIGFFIGYCYCLFA